MVKLTLRQRRERAGLSLSVLAERVGISESQLSRIERSESGTTRPVMAALERALTEARAA